MEKEPSRLEIKTRWGLKKRIPIIKPKRERILENMNSMVKRVKEEN